MPEMTPLEAARTAKFLENMAEDINDTMEYKAMDEWKIDIRKNDAEQLKKAASILRRVASGELAPVVHCRDCNQWHDNYCDTFSADVGPDFFCANGARMDGKDDSRETD